MVQGEPWGLHGFFSTFRLACSNLRQENEEVWRCSSLSSICWDYVLNGKCSDWCPVECVGCYHCGVMCFDWLPSWYCVCVGCPLCICFKVTIQRCGKHFSHQGLAVTMRFNPGGNVHLFIYFSRIF